MPSNDRRCQQWKLRTKTLSIDMSPLVMGIVNVTPDSFSDGGEYLDPPSAIDRALEMVDEGANILDVGGESTRPYSTPVSAEEELRRVENVVAGICAQTDIPVSIDTSKAIVARRAMDAGAEIINDVTGMEGDRDMIDVALESGAGVCVMHAQGTPQTMQDSPQYENVVEEIFRYLQMRKETLISAGIEPARICLDPGIGFGKTHEHNIELVQGCGRFLELDSPILVGHSRKGFIGKLIGDKQADRTAATLGISIALAASGMHVLRVHDVRQTVYGLRTFFASRSVD